MPRQNKKIEPPTNVLVFDTYLAVIKNSVGSKMFRNFYVKVGGKKTDIMRNGMYSCAFYVSSILALFKMIKETHGTVNSTIEELRKHGWRKIKTPKPGSVLVWEAVDFGGGDIHKHIGFYIGNGEAVSNNYKLGSPAKHNWKFGGKRKVEAILWKTDSVKN